MSLDTGKAIENNKQIRHRLLCVACYSGLPDAIDVTLDYLIPIAMMFDC